MKTMTFIIVVLVICFGFVLDVKADPAVPCDVTVVGQDNPGMDVSAVQAAVDGPHSSENVTVCLEGTFDFGSGLVPTNRVIVLNVPHTDPSLSVDELNIIGKDDADGNKATIRNGHQAISFHQDSTLSRLRIKNLRFEGPAFTAISCFRGNELVEISGNEIDGITTLLVPAFNLYFREGIAFTSFFAAINGTILIENNTVDGGAYDPLNPGDVNMVNFGIGIVGQAPPGPNPNPVTAEVTIRNNTIRNWSGTSILVQGLDPKLVIENNLIEPGSFANSPANPAACVANGIVLLNEDEDMVLGNTIHKVPSLRADGNPPACTTGISLVLESRGHLFKANKIDGVGTYAINLVGNEAQESNVSVGNNLTGFNPVTTDPNNNILAATVFLGPSAMGNTFVGNSGTVSGNTSANTITGLTPVAGGVGGEVSDAVSGM